MPKPSGLSSRRIKTLILSGIGVATLLGGLVGPLWSVTHPPTENQEQSSNQR